MKYFYIAVAETKYVDKVFEVIREWDERMRKIRGIRVGVLIRFAKWKRACLPCKLAERYYVPLFVDNGAFEYLTAAALEQPELDTRIIEKWLTQYASWLSQWYSYLVAAALPDVPVHGREFLLPDLRAKRIELTARLHADFAQRLWRLEPAALGKTVVVLQGYTLEEYLYSMKLHMENADLLGETQSLSNDASKPYAGVFGVGSVCVRKPSARGKTGVLAEGKAAGTLAEFMAEFLGYEWPSSVRGFHFFGLHTEAVRKFGTHPRYHASDTGAHGLNYKYKWRTRLGCKALDADCYARAVESQLRTTLGSLAAPELPVAGGS